MKKIASGIIVCTAIAVLASGATHLDDKELGIGDYRDQAAVDILHLDDQDLGIGDYRERA